MVTLIVLIFAASVIAFLAGTFGIVASINWDQLGKALFALALALVFALMQGLV
jgi:hypothetical protein